MTLKARTPSALPSLLQGRTDVDGKTKVGILQFFDKCDCVVDIIENRGNRRWTRDAMDNTFEVAFVIPAPMHDGVQILGWMKDRSVTCVAHIDRVVLASDLQKSPLLFYGVCIVDAARRNRKDDEVVIKTLTRSVSMERI